MKHLLLLSGLLLSLSLLSAQALPQVATGRLYRLADFSSQHVRPRHVDIWLPSHYDGKKRFDVLYMHDGQMLYDAAATWNGQAWEVEETAAALQAEGEVRDFIVVGIWNAGPMRHMNYFPQKPFEALTASERDTVEAQLRQAKRGEGHFQPNSDAYLRFLVTELKPYIDSAFAVNTARAHTFVAGSSMGGLISIYALCEYPEVFGGAACLSTHWPGTFTLAHNPVPAAFFRYLRDHLPPPRQHRIYFDHGDQTLDALYPALQPQVDVIMEEKGYTSPAWETHFFPGANHSEAAWRERLALPLRFLLGK